MSAFDLSTLLNQSRSLLPSDSRQDMPEIALGLDQIEAQSRKLYSKVAHPDGEDRGNYLLAQAHVNASQLADQVNNWDPLLTFQPLQPLQDTDVTGYLRHAHEQALISTVEETRRETMDVFYRSLEDKVAKNWEARKKKVFEELSGHAGAVLTAPIAAGFFNPTKSVGEGGISMAMHTSMMAYDRVVTQLNESRLQGMNVPIVHALIDATRKLPADSKHDQTIQTLELLASIINESDVRSATFQQSPMGPRHYAVAYLSSPPDSQEAKELRRRFVHGGMKWLEHTCLEYIEQTLASNPIEAAVGGNPTASNKIRAYIALKYYKGGGWQQGLELTRGQPMWAKIYLLLRIGHSEEALAEAQRQESALDKHDPFFFPAMREWVTSPDHYVQKHLRERLLISYNTTIRHVPSVDPFKHALFKLFSRAESNKRNLASVTSTTEDYLWYQLAMVYEGSQQDLGAKHSLIELGNVLAGYGEKSFDTDTRRPWIFSRVMLLCGQFERAVASLYNKPQYQIDAVHMAIALAYYGLIRVPSPGKESDIEIMTKDENSSEAYLNFVTMIARYIRTFQRSDPKDALQYVYLICLNSDTKGPAGLAQQKAAQELCRRVVVESAIPDELLGGVRPDGVRFPGEVEKHIQLLGIKNSAEYHHSIVHAAAEQSELDNRLIDAIKLYNLAEEYDKVVRCLVRSVGVTLSEPAGTSGEGDQVRQIATSLLQHYTTDPAIRGKVSDDAVQTCMKLLRLREAFEQLEELELDKALSTMESTGVVPLDVKVAEIAHRASEFKQLDNAIISNLDRIMVATMNILWGLHMRAKEYNDPGLSQQRQTIIRDKARRLMIFAGMLKYKMSNETYSTLTKIDVDIAN